jgi:hypothetical protein
MNKSILKMAPACCGGVFSSFGYGYCLFSI